MKEFKMQDALDAAKQLGFDFETAGFAPAEFLEGMNIELEHGLLDPETNVTSDDLIKTAKIAYAHLKENTLYYNEDIGLEAWEHALDKFKGDTKGKKITFV